MNFKPKFKRLFILLLLVYGSMAYGYDAGKVSFQLVINETATNLSRYFSPVMPGKSLNLKVLKTGVDVFEIESNYGKIIQKDEGNWEYIPPIQTGSYEVTITKVSSNEKIHLLVFVLVDALQQKGEYLNEYKIGKYPEKLFRNNPAYKQPEGFIEVTDANKDLYLTPHFQLKQFICKQQPNSKKKYVLLSPRLLIKLELLLEKLNQHGIVSDGLFVMSGYRTPSYNAAIGNGKYSRHIYGDAADVYVDNNADGVIDDLNRDGTHSMEDAIKMYKSVEEIDNDPDFSNLIGGLGKYKKTSNHTWNIHVDTRGYKARW